MKKGLAYLLITSILIIISGCGRQENNEATEMWSEPLIESIVEEPPEDSTETEDSAEAEDRATTQDQAITQEQSQTTDQPEVEDQTKTPTEQQTESAPSGLLTTTADLQLTDTDGSGKNYTFTYDGEEFRAKYTTDNWRIFDSYRINNESDMTIICQALIDEHPVHGSDMESYRTADDMVDEWVIHNMAYALLQEDDPLKSHAKDVDFDPKDQNKSFEEFYKDRTGKDFNMNDLFERMASQSETQNNDN